LAENKFDGSPARSHICFAMSRQAAGCAEWELEADRSLSIAECWARLREAFPALGPLEKTARLARGEMYLGAGERIEPGDEIAVIPPVSGG
jgi:molybdopterin converting factor small subunit